MSKVGVSFKIDVTNIDKARLFSGQKGKYLDATVFIDLDQLDQYGNSGMITQDVTKEEKNQGVKGNILGNCKVFWSESNSQPARQQAAQQQAPQQAPQQQGGFSQQTQGQQQNQSSFGAQQQAPQVNQQAPTIEFDDDIPFR